MNVLEVSGVSLVYGHGRNAFPALHDVSIDVPRGSITGIVGESGSGKSTLARAIVGLVEASEGSIRFEGTDIVRARGAAAAHRRGIQMVFQDPQSCLDPRMTVGACIDEGIQAAVRRGALTRQSRSQRWARTRELLEIVRLDPRLAEAYPAALSGGQRQRVALVRAVAAQPRLLIADEITSALDVSVQGSVLNSLLDLHAQVELSLLFITHNVPIVRQLCDRVVVMQHGRVVESGTSTEVIGSPREEYTRELLDAVPRLGTPLFSGPTTVPGA